MEDYSKYKKKELVEIMNHLDTRVECIGDTAVKMCEILSCDNCPVKIYDCDIRTEDDKCLRHMLCCESLRRWIIDEAKKC